MLEEFVNMLPNTTRPRPVWCRNKLLHLGLLGVITEKSQNYALNHPKSLLLEDTYW